MPRKKKTQPKGPFFYFMLDLKQRYEREGRRFPNGLADVKDIASPLWEKLSAEEKAEYKKRAEEEKGKESSRPFERYDTYGNPISMKLKAADDAEARRNSMYQDITAEVASLIESRDLHRQYFYVGHMNYMVVTDEKEYYPREIGIVKFSLREGIVGFYHKFIDPGELRLGYSFEAKDYSEKNHKIPTYNFDLATKDYLEVVVEVEQFLRQDDSSLAPLYFETKGFEGYNYMLNFLIDRCPESIPNVGEHGGIQTRHLTKLFYELRKQGLPNDPYFAFPSITYAGELLWKKEFDYFPELACEWHGEQDAPQNCSLSIARRFAYFISHFCCPAYNLELVPGRHFPCGLTKDDIEPAEPVILRKQEPDPKPQLPSVPKAPSARTCRIAARFGALPSASAGSSGAGRGILSLANMSGSQRTTTGTVHSFANAVGNPETSGVHGTRTQLQGLSLNEGANGDSFPNQRPFIGRGRGRGSNLNFV